MLISIPRYIKRILFILAIIVSVVIIVVAVSYVIIHLNTNRYIYNEDSALPHTQAAMILGAAVLLDGSLSPALRDRVDTAIKIYKDGKVDKILVSGSNSTTTYNEVNPVRNYLLKNGIPDQDIFLDHAGFDTYSSMYRARDVFNVQSFVAVSQSFHLPRAVYVARQLGLNAYGMNADKGHYLLYNYFREIFADVKAVWDLSLNRQPKYLGEVISITGDGSKNP